MLGSVKAKLEDIKAYVDKDGVYLDLKYKDAKLEDGRKVKVHIPKIRLPIPTKALPDVIEKHQYDLGSKFFLQLGTDELELVPSKITTENGLGEKATRNNISYVTINQEVTYSICTNYNGNGIPIEIKCADRVKIMYREGTIDVL